MFPMWFPGFGELESNNFEAMAIFDNNPKPSAV